MNSSFLAFGTDILDEGLETVLDNVQHRGGVGGVTLASAYHDARDVFTHNPRRVVHFHEPGAVIFQPGPDRFLGSLTPVVSELIAGRDLVDELVAGAAPRGIDANAWIVLLHVDRGREIEAFACRNAFGDLYPTHLCPANPHVRSYARDLVAEVASRGVNAILLEAFHFLPFEHGYHHERAFIEIAPITSFLLSLCFCESCLSAANACGIDGPALQGRVQIAIRDALSHGAETSPVEVQESVAGMFDGAMAGFLQARANTVSTLVRELVEAAREAHPETELIPIDPSGAIKGYAGGLPTGAPAAEISWKIGVDLPEIAKHVGAIEVMGYAATAERILLDYEGYRRAIPDSTKLGLILRPLRPDCESPANLRTKLEMLASLRTNRIDFYHYGLAPLESLDWVRSSLPGAD